MLNAGSWARHHNITHTLSHIHKHPSLPHSRVREREREGQMGRVVSIGGLLNHSENVLLFLPTYSSTVRMGRKPSRLCFAFSSSRVFLHFEGAQGRVPRGRATERERDKSSIHSSMHVCLFVLGLFFFSASSFCFSVRAPLWRLDGIDSQA